MLRQQQQLPWNKKEEEEMKYIFINVYKKERKKRNRSVPLRRQEKGESGATGIFHVGGGWQG